MVRKNRRGITCPRLPARDRSSEWQALYQPSERVEAGFDEEKDKEVDESRGMVGDVNSSVTLCVLCGKDLKTCNHNRGRRGMIQWLHGVRSGFLRHAAVRRCPSGGPLSTVRRSQAWPRGESTKVWIPATCFCKKKWQSRQRTQQKLWPRSWARLAPI